MPNPIQAIFTVDHEPDKFLSYSITDKDGDQRIDIFLASQVKDLTRSRGQELIKTGFVKVNDRFPKTSYRLKPGDQISISIPPVTPWHLEPEAVDFSLIHEDSSLIVLNKPAGLVIHPAPGHPTGTLVHGLLHYCKDLSGIGGVIRPGIVHRLDKETSGVMVAAKNDRAHNFLASQFKSGLVKKSYLAIVHGFIRGEKGEIDAPVGRHPKKRKEMSVLSSRGKRAITLWQKMEEFESGFSLLLITPRTGRTHQIRVHLSHIGHPIVGDTVYGYKQSWWKNRLPMKNHIFSIIKRHMLHAETLGFIHPDSDSYSEFKAPLPDDMDRILKRLKLMAQKDKRDKNT